MNQLETLFQQTFEDGIFTRAERKALRAAVKDTQPTPQTLGALRAKVFEMVDAQLDDAHASQLLQWLREANKVLLPKADQGEDLDQRVYFSPGNACLDAILHRIRSCSDQLDICVFTISDNRISEEIIRCHRRRVRVRVISDNDKMWDKGSDIEQLSRAGVSVRIDQSPHHMHHKFALFDTSYLITGSYNWTRSAATRNEENLLVSNDPQLFASYQKEFGKLWEECEPV
ncbi:MAG: phospholipase D-like domain-containing protein [Bacteroidota bacterium]